MTSNRPVGAEFQKGDEVVLAEGTYQGTLGVFVRLRKDVNWADISERNGSIRSHPVAWLDHSTGAICASWTDAGGPGSRLKAGGESQMNSSLNKDIEAWEGEGGAACGPSGMCATSMSGTASQVEWAERIKRRVDGEFDRVAASFRSIAHGQDDDKRTDTEAVIAILEEKRSEVMSREQAGYFIRDWQQISDQVRQMIFRDARYQAIKSNRPARRRVILTDTQ